MLKRLFFILLFPSVLLGQQLPAPSQPQVPPAQPQVINFGWVPPSPEERALAQDNIYTQQLRELVKYNDDKDVFLYRALFEVLKKSNMLTQEELSTGRLESLNQKNVGSCVGYSSCILVDVTAAVNVVHRPGMGQTWKVRANPDAIYAIGRLGNLGRTDGSTCGWSATNMNKYGTLFRLQYPGHDLTNTEPTDGRAWAAQGLPKELIELAAEHKALAYVKVNNIEEAKALIQNGYCIMTGAQASYPEVRDAQGFSARNGTQWSHALTFLSWRGASSGREGFLCQNSWARWNSGPIFPEDQPHGSFWVSPKDLEFHLKQGDSYSISDFQGFKRRNLKWEELFKIGEEIDVEDN